MKLCGSDIIVRTLIEQGCDVVFGYPGGQIINVYDSLYKYQDELRHVLTAHEQGAAHAADGYARATGKVGVVLATSGPGATNLVTGIATAYIDSVPLVAITGNVSNAVIGTDGFQEIDITGITLPITKHNYFVGCVEDLADTIREAFHLAMSGRPGPVLIDVPKDVQMALYDYEPQPPVQPDEKSPAKEIRIRQAAECINAAQRPFVYFGGGLISSGAQAELLELAEKLDAPLGCSMMGLSGVPTDHPRFLGMQGMHGHFACSMAMHKADCIIALGVRFNDRVTGNRAKFATGAKIVHIDIDGAELSKTVEAAHGLRGDMKLTLQKLIPLLNRVERPDWQEQIARLREEERASQDERPGMTPRRVLSMLNRYLGENTPVSTDVGQHQMWAIQHFHFDYPGQLLTSGGFGTMGFGLGAAIGAQVAHPGKCVLHITGDGGFRMNCNELATESYYKLPIINVVFNNGTLGMVRQWQTLIYNKRYASTTLDRAPDFVKLADAYGLSGRRVTTVEELEAALHEALACGHGYIIDCVIDMDEKVRPMVGGGSHITDFMLNS